MPDIQPKAGDLIQIRIKYEGEAAYVASGTEHAAEFDAPLDWEGEQG